MILLLANFFLFLSVITFIPLFWFKNKQVLIKPVKNPRICVIIPARDESKVIENLLLSLKKDNHKKDIYVIVESKEDQTIDICKKHDVNFFIRKRLDLRTKGYAIDELIKDLKHKEIFYDLYFIFDADNIVAEDFFDYMLEDYQKGYMVTTGYRDILNKNTIISISSGLTFTMINDLRNKFAMKRDGNLLLSGTGFYIAGDLIKEWGGFKFTSLTEDYEMSLYCAAHNISTYYDDRALFYDEQPSNMKYSIVQRIRWINGYFYNFFKYQRILSKRFKKALNKESIIEMKVGILPVIFFIAYLILLLIYITVNYGLKHLLFALLIVYLILVIFSLFLLKTSKSKLSLKMMLLVSLYNPLYLTSFVYVFFASILKKDLKWETIRHEGGLSEKISQFKDI